jgi:trypsin
MRQIVFAAVVVVGGCTSQDVVAPGQMSRVAALTNGTQTNAHPAVGKLLLKGPAGYNLCGGTLVGPQTVLTAAHCFDAGADSGTFEVGGQVIEVATITIHPAWDAGLLINDLALLRLQHMPTGVVPSEVAVDPPVKGAQLLLLGFGETVEGRGDYGVKRSARNSVLDIEATRFGFAGTGSNTGNLCRGDSGAPSLVFQQGHWQVVGVHSFARGPSGDLCGHYGMDARVDVARGWLTRASNGDIRLATPSSKMDAGGDTDAGHLDGGAAMRPDLRQQDLGQGDLENGPDHGSDIGATQDALDEPKRDAMPNADVVAHNADGGAHGGTQRATSSDGCRVASGSGTCLSLWPLILLGLWCSRLVCCRLRSNHERTKGVL